MPECWYRARVRPDVPCHMDIVAPHRSEIAALCRKFRVRRLELIGSAARGDFDPARSDLDFLVEFDDLGWEGSPSRYLGLLFGLEDLFHRKIDLIEFSAVRNPRFTQVATRHRELVYDAGSPEHVVKDAAAGRTAACPSLLARVPPERALNNHSPAAFHTASTFTLNPSSMADAASSPAP